ncbi:hypothetical protein AKJ09_03404 [Labilithrix luteola]|uniref:Uncharacterized protein n=1 Tax=Labilithrix luteola TaxID=1391654 RepID=A0A0K1PT81_9BACT|nr:hypothetical protein AKJ09_03404 [Labilithrix luteola]
MALVVSAGCTAASSRVSSGGAFTEAVVDATVSDGGRSRAASPPSDGATFECPDAVDGSPPSWCSEGSWCEYGQAVDRSCNDQLHCVKGSWKTLPKECAVTCPETWDEIAEGSACSDAEQICTFDEGTCGCVMAESDAGLDDADSDGGDASVERRGRWTCARAASGCPGRRPLIGNPCVKDMTCDYGTEVFGIDLTFACVNRQWR